MVPRLLLLALALAAVSRAARVELVAGGSEDRTGIPAVRAALRKLKGDGIEALTVSLMNAYLNGAHEARIGEIAAAGADTFVAGSAIFGAPDYRATIASMRAAINSART